MTQWRWISAVSLTAMWLLLGGCTYSGSLGNVQCDGPEDCPEGSLCEGGYCVGEGVVDLDAGPDEPDADEPDADEPDADDRDVDPNSCEPETPAELCAEANAECGNILLYDRCGSERVIECDNVAELGCAFPLACDNNRCECLDLEEENDPVGVICQAAGAQCGTITPGSVCSGWSDRGDVYCGDCPGDEECGEHIPNICGCPCEVDGVCYAAGPNPNNPCQVCDPEVSTESFTNVVDGMSCPAPDCQTGRCQAGSCQITPTCEGTEASCGCNTCVNCEELETVIVTNGPYDCCDGDQLCQCVDREIRSYFCDGDGGCDFTATPETGVLVPGSCDACTGPSSEAGASYECCQGGQTCTCTPTVALTYTCSGAACISVPGETTIATSGCGECPATCGTSTCVGDLDGGTCGEVEPACSGNDDDCGCDSCENCADLNINELVGEHYQCFITNGSPQCCMCRDRQITTYECNAQGTDCVVATDETLPDQIDEEFDCLPISDSECTDSWGD